jgi:hypothetical protein
VRRQRARGVGFGHSYSGASPAPPLSDELQPEVFALCDEDPGGSSRAEFVARAVVAGGGLVAGGVLVAGLPRLAVSAPSPAQDQKLLNFASCSSTSSRPSTQTRFRRAGSAAICSSYVSIVRGYERVHVAFPKGALGAKARKAPKKFTATAIELAKIVSVEARHAGWIRALADKDPLRRRPISRRRPPRSSRDVAGFLRSG